MADQDTATAPERVTIEQAIAQRSREEAAPKVAMGDDGLPESFSEEDLLQLSDAERAAIMADEDIQPKKEGADDAAAATDDDDQDDSDDDSSDDDGAAQVAPQAAEKKEEKVEPEPEPEFKPEPIPDVSEARAKLKDAQEALDALIDDFDDGELTKEEFKTKSKEYRDQILQYEGEVGKADEIAQRNKQTYAERWYSAVNDYTKDRAALMDRDGPLLPIWDRELKAVNTDPATSSIPTDRRLALAHERVLAAAKYAGIEIPKDMAPPPGATKRQEPKKMEARKDERDDIPPALAHMPATDTNGTDESRFTQIDRVIDQDPHLAEAAAERLSEAEMERFLRGE